MLLDTALDKLVSYTFTPKDICDIPAMLVKLDYLHNSTTARCDYLTLSHLEAEVRTYLNKLPHEILAFLCNKGWKIIFTDELGSLERRFEYPMEIYGCTDYQNKKIYIYAYNLAIKYALFHEIGHVIDISFGLTGLSNSSEWESIQSAHNHWNYQNYFIDNDKRNLEEFFANCVSLYVNDGETLQRINVHAYNFINNLFENIRYLIEIVSNDYTTENIKNN